jgi:hypothetical protein
MRAALSVCFFWGRVAESNHRVRNLSMLAGLEMNMGEGACFSSFLKPGQEN